MNRKSRVIDGVRTRDNRNHNPPRKKRFQLLTTILRALASAKKQRFARVGAPGPESDRDVMEPLRRVVCP